MSQNTKVDASAFISWIVLGGIAFAFVKFVVPDDWKSKQALLNGVSYDHTTVDEMPTACNWSRAPIGYKACHYEQKIYTTSWSKSTTGDTIVSYDNGENWKIGVPPKDAKIPTDYIYVTWIKKDDP